MPRRIAVLGAVTVCLLVGAAAALAAGGLAPQARSPKGGKKVRVGHVKLTVYVPDPGNAINGHIFLTISDKRTVNKGMLETPKHCGFRCDDATMKRVGHSHLYTYVDPYHFPGNWQDTPGKYFWQAFYYPKGGAIAVLVSGIPSFRVVS